MQSSVGQKKNTPKCQQVIPRPIDQLLTNSCHFLALSPPSESVSWMSQLPAWNKCHQVHTPKKKLKDGQHVLYSTLALLQFYLEPHHDPLNHTPQCATLAELPPAHAWGVSLGKTRGQPSSYIARTCGALAILCEFDFWCACSFTAGGSY